MHPLVLITAALACLSLPATHAQSAAPSEYYEATIAGSASDWFGCSVSSTLDGLTVAVGAWNELQRGAVYVYERPYAQSKLDVPDRVRLVASNGTENMYYGEEVFLSGNGLVLVVCARGAGAVYVYTRDRRTVPFSSAQENKLQPDDGSDPVASRYGFYNGLSEDGLTLAVGAPERGSLYVYTRSSLSEAFSVSSEVVLMAAGGSGGSLGWPTVVSRNGLVIAAGAAAYDGSQGRVFVFDRTSTSASFSSLNQHNLTATDGLPGARYGYSVSLSADGLLLGVGAINDVGGRGSAYVYTRSSPAVPFSTSSEVKLAPSGGGSPDRFGWAVTFSPDSLWFAVGHYGYAGHGAVEVFVRDQSTDSFEQANVHMFVATDASASDRFGYSVSLTSGPSLVVGATGAGKAYVFTNSPGVRLKPAGLVSYGKLASSADGRTIAIGLPTARVLSVYTRTSSNVEFTAGDEQRLTAAGDQTGSQLGIAPSISADGLVVAVGAPDDGAGVVYVFSRPSQDDDFPTSFDTRLAPTDGQAGDRFGWQLALSADGLTLAITARQFDSARGKVYVYTRLLRASPFATDSEVSLLASDGVQSDRFGQPLWLSSDGLTLASSAPYHDSVGAVYVYTRSSLQSSFSVSSEVKIQASDGASGDYYGDPVVLSGDGLTLAVGAYVADAVGQDSGKAYVYTRETTSAAFSVLSEVRLVPTDGVAGDGFGWQMSISDDGRALAITAWTDDEPSGAQGSVYVFTRGTLSNFSASNDIKISPFDWSQGPTRFGSNIIASSDLRTLTVRSDASNIVVFSCAPGEFFVDGQGGVCAPCADSSPLYCPGLSGTSCAASSPYVLESGTTLAPSTLGGSTLQLTVAYNTSERVTSAVGLPISGLNSTLTVRLVSGSDSALCRDDRAVLLRTFNVSASIQTVVANVSCVLPPRTGTGWRVQTMVGTAHCAEPSATISYPPATIATNNVSVLSSNAAKEPAPNTNIVRAKSLAPVRLSIPGKDFGTNVDAISVRYGDATDPNQFVCTVVELTSSALVCDTEGNEAERLQSSAQSETILFVLVFVEGQSAGPQRDEDAAQIGIVPFLELPVITGISGCNGTDSVIPDGTSQCPSAGGALLTLTGSNFLVNGTTSVLVGSVLCGNATVTSDDRLTCVLPPGVGSPPVMVITLTTTPTIKQRFGRTVQLLAYESVQLEGLACTSEVVQAGGSVFSDSVKCASDADSFSLSQCQVTCPRTDGILAFSAQGIGAIGGVSVSVSGQACAVIESSSPNELQCRLPRGIEQELSVAVRDQTSAVLVRSVLSFERCPEGHVVDNSSFTCTPCESGSITESPLSFECAACAAGQSAPAASAECSDCPRGRFSSEPGATSCSPCPVGRYQPGSGRRECLLCEPGSFSNASGAWNCSRCEGGLVSPGGSVACRPCPVGSVPGASSSECFQCRPGTTAVQGQCVLCPRGEFASDATGNLCTPCLPGTFAPTNGSDKCLECAQGRYVAGSGARACELCPLNEENRATGATSCTPCPPFKFTEQLGTDVCQSCVSGRYVQFADPVFGAGDPQRRKADCLPCPPGTSCADGAAFADEGVWVVLRPSDGVAQSWRCLAGRCPGCDLDASSRVDNSSVHSCCSSNRRSPESNPMCAQCIDGYVEWGGDCVECTDTNGGLLFAMLLSFFLVIVFMHVALNQASNSLGPIFVYFVQTTLLSFGEETQMLAWTSYFNLNPMQTAGGSACVAPWSPVEKMIVAALTPLLSWGFLALLFIGHYLWRLYRNGGSSHIKVSDMSTPYLRSSVSFFFFSYNAVASTSIRFFACVNVADRWNVVQSSPDIDCDSVEYKNAVGLFVFLLVVVVASPIALFFVLRQKKLRDLAGHDVVVRHAKGGDDAGDRAQARPSDSGSSSDAKRVLRVWGLLFELFNGHKRPVAHYWRVVILVRRVAVIGVIAITLGYSRATQYSALTIAHVLILISHMKFKPYRDMTIQGEFVVDAEHRQKERDRGVAVLRVNALEAVSLTLIVLCTAAVGATEVPLSSGNQAVFGVFIFGWMAVLLALIVWRLVARHRMLAAHAQQEADGLRRQSTVRGVDRELQRIPTARQSARHGGPDVSKEHGVLSSI